MKVIIGYCLLREASFDEDTRLGFDMIVLKTSGIKIACRLRKEEAARYPYDVTFTYKRETGARCEWDKVILGGLGDWFFYGHATKDDPALGKIDPWFILDLEKARPVLIRTPPTAEKPNKDPVGRRCFWRGWNLMKTPELQECVLFKSKSVEWPNIVKPNSPNGFGLTQGELF